MSTDIKQLSQLIAQCREAKSDKQEELYVLFYNYAMSICLRYSKDREEAIEIVNDGFMKVFQHLDKFQDHTSFKSWLRRIMINASIDYYRRNEKHYHNVDISYAKHEFITDDALDKLSEKEIINLIQSLPPSYRMVFNLFVIEGYSHPEISQKMNIGVGTSKSNLAIARSKLKRMVLGLQKESYLDHG